MVKRRRQPLPAALRARQRSHGDVQPQRRRVARRVDATSPSHHITDARRQRTEAHQAMTMDCQIGAGPTEDGSERGGAETRRRLALAEAQVPVLDAAAHAERGRPPGLPSTRSAPPRIVTPQGGLRGAGRLASALLARRTARSPTPREGPRGRWDGRAGDAGAPAEELLDGAAQGARRVGEADGRPLPRPRRPGWRMPS